MEKHQRRTATTLIHVHFLFAARFSEGDSHSCCDARQVLDTTEEFRSPTKLGPSNLAIIFMAEVLFSPTKLLQQSRHTVFHSVSSYITMLQCSMPNEFEYEHGLNAQNTDFVFASFAAAAFNVIESRNDVLPNQKILNFQVYFQTSTSG